MQRRIANGRLVLTARRDAMDLGLGAVLGLIALACCYGAPRAYTETWSYRFGQTSYGFRLTSALIGAVVAIVAGIGSTYNLFKRDVHTFDSTCRRYEGGECLFGYSVMIRACAYDEIVQVVIEAGRQGGADAYWVCLLLHNRNRVHVGICLKNHAAAQEIANTIAAHGGWSVAEQSETGI